MNSMKFALVLVLITNILHSQSTIGSFESIISENENNIELKATNGIVKIELCTSSIIRFRTSWNGTFEANEPWMVTKYAWENVNYIKAEDNEALDFMTKELRIHIQKSPLLISIYDIDGKLLSSEKIGDTELSGGIMKNKTVSSVKKLMPDEHFFGFGERMDFLDQRGKNVSLNVGRGQGRPHIIGAYNVLEANYSPIPFFMRTEGYGIFFHLRARFYFYFR